MLSMVSAMSLEGWLIRPKLGYVDGELALFLGNRMHLGVDRVDGESRSPNIGLVIRDAVLHHER